jgi:hypothetical protein
MNYRDVAKLFHLLIRPIMPEYVHQTNTRLQIYFKISLHLIVYASYFLGRNYFCRITRWFLCSQKGEHIAFTIRPYVVLVRSITSHSGRGHCDGVQCQRTMTLVCNFWIISPFRKILSGHNSDTIRERYEHETL